MQRALLVDSVYARQLAAHTALGLGDIEAAVRLLLALSAEDFHAAERARACLQALRDATGEREREAAVRTLVALAPAGLDGAAARHR